MLFQGLYPPVYDQPVTPVIWADNYINTYIERDVRQLVNVKDLSSFQRFVKSCAARTGQLLNLSRLANNCGVTSGTAKAWLSVLEAIYLIHLLPPHFKNFNKRVIKSPKLYFLDVEIASRLLGVQQADQFITHPMRGELFESWVVSELLKGRRFSQGLSSNLYFWRDHASEKIDVLIETGLSLNPVEIKSGQTLMSGTFQGLFKWQAMTGEQSGPGWVVYGGDGKQQRQGLTMLPWQQMHQLVETV